MNDTNRGQQKWSIILFEKMPYMNHVKVLTEKEVREKGYGVENIVVQYKCFLQIDLWICVIATTWLTRLKKNEN